MIIDNISINIDNELTIRLGVYADSKGKKSLADAIQCLLDDADKSPTSRPTIDEDSNRGYGNALPFYHRPMVEYFVDDDSPQISEKDFKRELLKAKRAKVVLVYHNNKPKEEKVWHADNLTEDSNVKGNLNTGYLRNWRQKGIKKLQLYISSR